MVPAHADHGDVWGEPGVHLLEVLLLTRPHLGELDRNIEPYQRTFQLKTLSGKASTRSPQTTKKAGLGRRLFRISTLFLQILASDWLSGQMQASDWLLPA